MYRSIKSWIATARVRGQKETSVPNHYTTWYRKKFFAAHIPSGARILHINAQYGPITDVLHPSYACAVGIQPANNSSNATWFSHVNLLIPTDIFDYIIISITGMQKDSLHQVIQMVEQHTSPHTSFIIDVINSKPRATEWYRFANTINAHIVLYHHYLVLSTYIPCISTMVNRFCSLLPGMRRLSTYTCIIFNRRIASQDSSVSIIIPCRNEEGNILSTILRSPQLGAHTELIFVEGHSTDKTADKVMHMQALYPAKNIRLLVQTGMGKSNAVHEGIIYSRGDIIMILDADVTVDPTELSLFYTTLTAGLAQFANGVRALKEPGAMPWINRCANYFFAQVLSYIIRQKIGDSLCGTKVFWKRDYEIIMKNKLFFGNLDPFGDFDLLLGAARLNRTIRNIEVAYRSRPYGTTNIRHFYEVWFLLYLCLRAFSRLRFW